MRNVYKYIFLTGIVLAFSKSSAQKLITGQVIPDLQFTQVINYTGVLKTADLKGRLIIFDFWNPACSSCIAAFPQLVKLQKQFNKDIQIILVNRESRDSTLRFFKKRKAIRIPELPMITEDLKLFTLFPYIYFPYQVWIDKNGLYRFLTDAYNATPEHIQQLLMDKKIDIVNYKKEVEKTPILAGAAPNWEQKYLYFSYITRCQDDFNVGFYTGSKVNNKQSVRLSMNCSSIVDLYKEAYQENNKYDLRASSTIVLKVQDTTIYRRPKDSNLRDVWQSLNGYNYDSMLPVNQANNLYQVMQEDLHRYFDLDAQIQKRIMPCLVLIKSNTMNRQAIESYLAGSIYKEKGLFKDFSDGLSYLLEQNQPLPFLDETGIQGAFESIIRKQSIEPLNLNELRKDLQNEGLDLVRKDREISVLVLREKNYNRKSN